MVRKSLSREIQKILFGSSLICSLGLSHAATAQEAEDAAADEETVEVINVVGIRSSLVENLALKRDSANFVDAITAEDIGKFPDRNVADALQRVPGVSITRSGGEGRSVSIRGTSSALTMTLLNGNYVATGSNSREPSRSFNFSLMPANLIKTVEVHKTPQAKVEEGGLGGTVILHTREPLSEKANSGFFSLEGTYADVTEELEPQYSGLYSWKNEDEDFGILVSYVSQDRTTITESVSTENWNEFGAGGIVDTNGNDILGFAPFAVVQGKNDEQREREGVQLTTQWAPSDDLMLTFNYFGASLTQNNDNNIFLLAEWDNNKSAVLRDAVRMNDEGIISAIQWANVDAQGNPINLQAPAIGSRRTLSEATSDTFDLKAEYTGDWYDLTAKIGKTSSDAGTTFDNLQRFNSSSNPTSAGYGWDLNADTIINSNSQITDFGTNGWRSQDAGITSDEETYAQLDASFEVDYGIITSIDAGVKRRDHKINRTLNNETWDTDSLTDGTIWGGCCHDEWWMTDTAVALVEAEAATGSFFKEVHTTGEASTQSSFFALDWDSFIGFMDQNFIRRQSTQNSFFFNVNEEITSAYVQTNFEYEAWSGNFGLRYVNTEQEVETFDTIGGATSSELQTREGSYNDILPSLNIKYDLTDDVVLRASAAKVMARVGYGSLGASESIDQPATDTFITAGRAGNPNLKPYEAKQYDLGVEWYFGEGSFLGGGIYRKDIDSYVVTDFFEETRTLPNIDQPVLVRFSGPVNLGGAATQGLEFVYQQTFDSGFGVLFNYTYTDPKEGTYTTSGGEERTLVLPGSSKNQYNLSVFYENETFSARASYNYRSDTPAGTQNGYEQTTEARGQIDLNASYNLMENLVLNASIINLTKELDESYLEGGRLAGRSYSGRIMYAGATYKF